MRTPTYVRSLRRDPCHYCGTDPGGTVDHVVPLAHGGPWAHWNLVPACGPCNNRKGDSRTTCECAFCRAALARFDGKVFISEVSPVAAPRARGNATDYFRKLMAERGWR